MCVGVAKSDIADKDLGTSSNNLSRIEPLASTKSLAAIHARPGFRVELVAAEPLVRDPVAMQFDEFGRIYVVELPPYNQYAKEDSKLKASIRLLSDINGDGRFEKSTMFADDLRYATGIACYDGGVFVGDAPDLLYLKDTDGDGFADLREVIFTGFGQDEAGEGQLNSFRWGVDNRLHVSTGLDGGEVRPSDQPDAVPWLVRNRGFAFDPRTRAVDLTSGGGQHGMSFDDWGRKFVCGNSDPCQLLLYEDHYLSRNPLMTAPAPGVSIAPEGKHTKVFRISPIDPWRLIRTKMRSEGKFRGSDEGGEAGGFFTAGTGVTIYRGDAWPDAYHGDLLVGEAANNLIYHATLEPNGLSMIARRADADAEFLASTDNWFRPVQFAHGPDGALYVLDMYRELIEGAAFLPPQLLGQMDVTAGSDRGRIYRIVPKGFQQPAPVRLGNLTTVKLVAVLEHRNGWHRDTAARLLYQRKDQNAIGPVRILAAQSTYPQARMHALYALNSLDSLRPDDLLVALSDDHPRVREHAVRLAEQFAKTSPEIGQRLTAMTADADLHVRFQLAFSLGYLPHELRDPALVDLLLSNGESEWFRMAVQSSLGQGAIGVLRLLLAETQFCNTSHGRKFMASLARQISRANQADEIRSTIAAIDAMLVDSKGADALAQNLLAGLLQNRKGVAARLLAKAEGGRIDRIMGSMLAKARAVATDHDQTVEARTAAIHTLGCGNFSSQRQLLADLLTPQQPQSIQDAALTTLASFTDVGVAELLLGSWATLTPRLRGVAVEALLSRPAWTAHLLDAVEQQQVPRGDIDPARVKLLQSYPDAALRERAAEVFARDGIARRAKVVADYQPALQLTGDVARGRQTFRKVCAACHRLEGVGTAVGADLQAIRDRGLEAVMLNILDPNREVKPQFLTYVVITADGRVITGTIAEESAASLTILRPDGTTITIARIDIDEISSTGLSYMPEGLEKQIDKQAMADLLAYLSSIE